MTPVDEDMNSVYQAYLANVKSRIAGAKVSQLAMAAPLESGGSAKPKVQAVVEPKKSNEPRMPSNQKAGLVNGLLAVGALRPAIAMLSKYLWLVDAFPEIADLMLRILKHSMSPLYDSTLGKDPRTGSFTTPRSRYGSTGMAPAPERKPQLTLWAPTPASTLTTEFVFFFPTWSERIPVCRADNDIMDVLEPLMRFVGLHVSRDPAFLAKFLRLGRAHLIATVLSLDLL